MAIRYWIFFLFTRKTAYCVRISDWSSDVCSSDLGGASMLDAGAGNLVVTDIASAGAITAAGALVNLGSSGAMNVAQAIASTGPLTLNAGGPLSLSGSASGRTLAIGARDRNRVV